MRRFRVSYPPSRVSCLVSPVTPAPPHPRLPKETQRQQTGNHTDDPSKDKDIAHPKQRAEESRSHAEACGAHPDGIVQRNVSSAFARTQIAVANARVVWSRSARTTFSSTSFAVWWKSK